MIWLLGSMCCGIAHLVGVTPADAAIAVVEEQLVGSAGDAGDTLHAMGAELAAEAVFAGGQLASFLAGALTDNQARHRA